MMSNISLEELDEAKNLLLDAYNTLDYFRLVISPAKKINIGF